MALRELIFDAWTAMGFKRALQPPRTTTEKRTYAPKYHLPVWVGEDNHRRLTAYTILQSYVDNSAREFLQTDDAEQREQHREYGDAAVIVESIVDSLLGEDQIIVVPDAAEYNPDLDETLEGEDNNFTDDQRDAYELQEWLNEWGSAERLMLKMIETETDAVALGDGVYSLGWDSSKGRVRLRMWDPGFYFPVLDDGNEDDYPKKIHIAWELQREPGEQRAIRRITWELADINMRVETQVEARERLGLPENVQVVEERLQYVLRDGDRVDDEGRIYRTYPYSDEPSYVTCYMSDGVWDLPDGGKHGVNDLDESKARWKVNGKGEELNHLDIGIDFMPVIHVPNTISGKNHFGKSSLSTVLQILDDLSNADTDLQAASATTGSPVIALQGSALTENAKQSLTYAPGEIFETGDGRMTMLDTSSSLDALLKYVDALLQRLSINSRLPESILGRIKPSEVPSGLALSLSFGPLTSMVRKMRKVRDEKYPIMLKFIWRMTLANEGDAPSKWFDARVQFGRYLPSDRSAIVNEVRELLNTTSGRAISTQTAVLTLQEAGYSIDDAVEEVARIRAENFAGADELRAALEGQIDEVRSYLGMKPLTADERKKRNEEAMAGLPDPNAPGEGEDEEEDGPPADDDAPPAPRREPANAGA